MSWSSYEFCIKHFYILTTITITTVQLFEVILERFNIVEICTGGSGSPNCVIIHLFRMKHEVGTVSSLRTCFMWVWKYPRGTARYLSSQLAPEVYNFGAAILNRGSSLWVTLWEGDFTCAFCRHARGIKRVLMNGPSYRLVPVWVNCLIFV